MEWRRCVILQCRFRAGWGFWVQWLVGGSARRGGVLAPLSGRRRCGGPLPARGTAAGPRVAPAAPRASAGGGRGWGGHAGLAGSGRGLGRGRGGRAGGGGAVRGAAAVLERDR